MSKPKEEVIERYKEAEARVRNGESESEVVELPSGTVRLTRDESSMTGISIEVVDGGGAHTEGGGGAGGSGPDPKAMEAMERMKEVMERFKAGELETAEIPLPTGDVVRLTKSDRAPGAFTVQKPGGGPTMHSIPFDAHSERPEGYPDDLPFLPDVPASMTEFEKRPERTVNWFGLPDPDAGLAELRAQLEADGWVEEAEMTMPNPFGTMTSVTFRKGDVERGLVVTRLSEHTKIMLVEKIEKRG